MENHPGRLYVGREYDFAQNRPDPQPVFLTLRNLTTHAICLGMTGSGKTGLGIVTLEELLLQDIPCIVIDPKGDITNLALLFPEISAHDILRWVDVTEARHKLLTPEQLAEQSAHSWREGQRAWHITPERIARLRDRVSVEIYTPGSSAGLPINLLGQFSPPAQLNWQFHTEALRERISQVAQALLHLVGVAADPLKSREHILLSTIFEAAWRAGQPLDMIALIRMIQDPPVRRIGAFDVEVFYPREARFQLAMALNNVIASPTFAAWTEGIPLDVDALLQPRHDPHARSPRGRTPASIFYLAHLGETERQFFVTLLLSQLVLWMRAQSGTSLPRVLIYFDEVFGYAPPYPRNPPAKTPLMTLLKQGRASGVGVFLSTQNPADLDYRGLSNIGTWLIGRLQTERDRERVLEGLDQAELHFDRAYYSAVLSSLPPRVFLLHTLSAEPRFFHVRWPMSYLTGPLTRDQLAWVRSSSVEPPASSRSIEVAPSNSGVRPQVPHTVREVFMHPADSPQTGAICYQPKLLAIASARFSDRTAGVHCTQRYAWIASLDPSSAMPDLATAQAITPPQKEALSAQPLPNAQFGELPFGLDGRWPKRAEQAVKDYMYHHLTLPLWVNRALKVYGAVGEEQWMVRQRCEVVARQKRDAEAARLHDNFERQMAALQERAARQHRVLERNAAELSARKREELLGGVEMLFNIVVGKRPIHGVAFSARRQRARELAQMRVEESKQVLAELNAALEALRDEYRQALESLNERWMRMIESMERIEIPLKKSAITIEMVALAWVAQPTS